MFAVNITLHVCADDAGEAGDAVFEMMSDFLSSDNSMRVIGYEEQSIYYMGD